MDLTIRWRGLIDRDMNTDQHTFIEELGVVFEESGAAPMLGRVYGALLISQEPQLTAEELATHLHASRGAISQATRQLVDMGMIRRTHKLGSRKDYFQVEPDGWVRLTRYRFQKADAMGDLFRRGLASIPDASPEARAALEENLEFLEYWRTIIDRFFSEWEQRKEEQRAQRNSND